MPRLLSVAEVARLFRRTERTIRSWVRLGYLTPIRIGRSLFFREDHIHDVLSGRLKKVILGHR